MSLKSKIILVCTMVILVAVGISAGFWSSANCLIVNNYTYTTAKLSEAEPLRFVILADLHEHEFGEGNSELIEKVREQDPDVIMLLGDFVNGTSESSTIACGLIEGLQGIAPIYFALGNHELDYMEHHSELISELENAGAVVLDKEYVDLEVNGAELRLGGMYDYAFGLNGRDEAEAAPEEVKHFLEDYQDTDRLKIMMAHRPDSFVFGNAAEYWDVDLVISAHNHGGQVVIPFLGGLYGGDQGWFPEYVHGMYEKGQMSLFASSGLGSHEQALPRFNNLPEIAVLKVSGR